MKPLVPRSKKHFWGRILDALFGYDFFISYAQKDGGCYALNLATALRDLGFECFLDTKDFSVGDHWQLMGELALRKTTRLIFVGTPAAFVSQPVLHEVRLFAAQQKRIIPIEFTSASFASVPSDNEILALLPKEILRLTESDETLLKGPSDKALRRLTAAFESQRQTQKRTRVLLAFTTLLGISLISAIFFGVVSNQRKNDAIGLLARSNFQLGCENRDAARDPIVTAHYFLASAQSAQRAGRVQEAAIAQYAAALNANHLIASFPHEGNIRGIEMSQDGEFALSFTEQGEARLWEMHLGAPVTEMLRHPGPITGAALARNNRRILTWSTNGNVCVWSVAKGQYAALCLSNAGPITGVTLSQNEQTIMTWFDGKKGSESKEVRGWFRLWSAADGLPCGSPVQAAGIDTSVSRKQMAFWRDHEAWLVDLDKRFTHPYVLRFSASIDFAKFSPKDDVLLLGAQASGMFALWSISNRQWLGRTIKLPGNLRECEFTCSGTNLYTYGDAPDSKGEICFWNVMSGLPIGKPRIVPWYPKLSTDTQELINWNKDMSFEIWNARDNRLSGKIDIPPGNVGFYYDSASQVLVTSDSDYKTYSAYHLAHRSGQGSSSTPLYLIRSDHTANLEPTFSPDGKLVLTYADGGMMDLWNAHNWSEGGPRLSLDPHVSDAKFVDHGRNILVWGTGPMARLWQVERPLPIGERERDQVISSLNGTSASLPYDKIGLVTSNGFSRPLWAKTGIPTAQPFPKPAASEIRVYTNGNIRVLIERNGDLSIVKSKQNQKIETIKLTAPARDVELTSDGSRMFVYMTNGAGCLWQTLKHRPLTPQIQFERPIPNCRFSDDERYWFAIDNEDTLKVFQTEDGAPVMLRSELTNQVVSVESIPHENSFVVVNEAEIWVVSAGDGKILGGPFPRFDPDFEFLARGRTILTSSNSMISVLRKTGNGYRQVAQIDDIHEFTHPILNASGDRIFVARQSIQGGTLLRANDGKQVGKELRWQSEGGYGVFSKSGLFLWVYDGDDLSVLRSDTGALIRQWKNLYGLGPGESIAEPSLGNIFVQIDSPPGSKGLRLLKIPKEAVGDLADAILEFEVRSATAQDEEGRFGALRPAEWEAKRIRLKKIGKK